MNGSSRFQPRILQVVASLRGGAAEQMLQLATHTTGLGWPTLLLAPDDCKVMKNKVQSLSIRWIPLTSERHAERSPVRKCRQILKDEAVDLVHFHGIRAGFFGRRALMRFRGQGQAPASVYTIHGFHPAHYTNPVTRRLTLLMEGFFLERCTDRLIFVSESDRTLFESQVAPARRKRRHSAFQKKSRLILNGVALTDKNTFPPKARARKEFNLPEDAWILLCISRFNYQKAVHVLIDAVAMLKDRIPRLLVLLAGDGPLEPELRAQANRLGLEKHLRFLGYVDRPSTLYAAADLFALTSLWEGLPLVLLEAAAAGLPIVATRAPGTVDVLEDGLTGLLVETNHPVALAESIIKLSCNPDQAQTLGRNARAIIPERFSLQPMLEATETVYREALAEIGDREKMA